MHYNEIVKVEYAFGWEEKLEEWGNFRYNHSTKLYETSLHARQFMSGQRWSGDGEKKIRKKVLVGRTLLFSFLTFLSLFCFFSTLKESLTFTLRIYIYIHTRAH